MTLERYKTYEHYEVERKLNMYESVADAMIDVFGHLIVIFSYLKKRKKKKDSCKYTTCSIFDA